MTRVGASDVRPERVAERLAGLVHRALDVESFFREAHGILQSAIRHDGVCWVSLDPQSLLPIAVYDNAFSREAARRAAVYSYTVPDFNDMTDAVSTGQLAATLSEATSGDLARSSWFRDILRPEGFGDELRGVFSAAHVQWGYAAFRRAIEEPSFTPADVEVVRAASCHLAEGIRRALVFDGRAGGGAGPDPGLILIDARDRIESMNGPAKTLMRQLIFDTSDEWAGIVHAIANRARLAVTDANAGLARARVPTRMGAWLTLHGSVLDESKRRVAVVIEPARDADLLPLVLEAYELTEREREITALLARGISTAAIADRLFLSPWTVKDHLKAIFEKVGVSSRAELVASIHLKRALEIADERAEEGSTAW